MSMSHRQPCNLAQRRRLGLELKGSQSQPAVTGTETGAKATVLAGTRGREEDSGGALIYPEGEASHQEETNGKYQDSVEECCRMGGRHGVCP